MFNVYVYILHPADERVPASASTSAVVAISMSWWRFRCASDCRLCEAEATFFLGAILFLCSTSQLTVEPPTYRIVSDSLNVMSRNGGGGKMRRSVATLPVSSYQIHVLKDVAGGEFAVSDWLQISRAWTCKSSYQDLLKSTQAVGTLPSVKMQSPSNRIIFILHIHPKMASTTLRRACWEHLRRTCNVVSPRRDPMGYSDENDLTTLIEKCEDTAHFCVKGWHYHSQNFPSNITISPSRPIAFIHLFPFRKYDEWAASATKQIFVGHSEAGCNEAAKRLEKCDGWLELDFAKYSKQNIAQMIELKNPRERQLHEHHFFLYNFSHVQPTLTRLSRSYQVPMMEYLDMQYKQSRRNGTCPIQTLERFHECFDNQLLHV